MKQFKNSLKESLKNSNNYSETQDSFDFSSSMDDVSSSQSFVGGLKIDVEEKEGEEIGGKNPLIKTLEEKKITPQDKWFSQSIFKEMKKFSNNTNSNVDVDIDFEEEKRPDFAFP